MNFPGISWLDVVMMLFLIASIAFGFHQGILRQGFLLLAFYLGTMLSAQYHGYVTPMLRSIFPTSSPEMAQLLAFMGTALAVGLVVTWAVWAAYRYTRLPDELMLDSASGALVGGVIGVLAIGLMLVLIRYAVQVPWPEDSPVKHYLSMGLSHSTLQSAIDSSIPTIQTALRPLLPESIPQILGS